MTPRLGSMSTPTLRTLAPVEGVSGLASSAAPRDAAPDLSVDAFWPSNSFPMPNDAVWYDVTIGNHGTAPAGAFSVEMRGSGGFFEQRIPNGLAPGASVRLTMGPAWAAFGGSQLSEEVLVDPRNEVPDANRGNNYQWSSVMVQQPPVIPLPPHPEAPATVPSNPTFLLAH
jgi:CARDB